MIDRFGRSITYLRLSVTDRCSLRCRYCMPEAAAPQKQREDLLTEDERICAVGAAAALGVTKLRITGGEPLLCRNILSLCSRAARTPGIAEVCLTTNGILLPRLAPALRAAGVRRVNISLDSLQSETYAHITRGGRLEDALAGLRAALAAGFDRVKINAVLMGGVNDGEIPALAELSRQYPVDVRFIELMPMGRGGALPPSAYLPCDTVLRRLPQLTPLEEEGGVARLYRLPGAVGRVGLISPISAHFCGACSRLRLTADGRLRPCLHSPVEFSLKGLDGAGMMRQFEAAAAAKPARHGELSETERSPAGLDMNELGG